MRRNKVFSGGTDISEFEELGFELNGHSFDCLPAIQGSVLLEFVRDADAADGAKSAKALYNFLESAMEESEYARLQEVLHDSKRIIHVETIGEIVSWLVEEYSSRPTERLEDSQDGQ